VLSVTISPVTFGSRIHDRCIETKFIDGAVCEGRVSRFCLRFPSHGNELD